MDFNFTPTSAMADAVFGIDLLSSLLGNVDIVGIYDGASQVFEKARPLKGSVREDSRTMDHPLETGAIITDHHILNPVEIEFPLFIPSQYYITTYQQIKNAYINGTLFSVKTAVNVYNNMFITGISHEEDPEFYSAIIMGMRLKQALFTVPDGSSFDANYAPVSPQDQSVVSGGLKSGIDMAKTAISMARSAMSYASLMSKF